MTEATVARWGIVGHDEVVEALAAGVVAGRVAHAWLITGPEGVGKAALALALARTLNCEAPPDARPCNVCGSCGRINRGAHPDVTLVDMKWQEVAIARPRGDRSSSRQRLSIDAMRFLRQDIATRPLLGRWKLQIIDDADLFSEVAPDAFLKTLEEPPPFAVVILIATSDDAVSETIRSRCRHVALGAVATETIRATLVERGASAEAAEQIARAARGRIGWALAMANSPRSLLERRERAQAAFEQIATPLGRIAISGTIARDHTRKRDATYAMLDLWMGLWRDALLHRAGLSDAVAYPELTDRLAPWSRHFELPDLYRAIWATRRCMSDLDANVQARVALHAMTALWPE